MPLIRPEKTFALFHMIFQYSEYYIYLEDDFSLKNT